MTLGNKAALNENDILQYFLTNQGRPELPEKTQDGLSNVQPIGLYLESIVNGAEFLKLTSQISETNPVFIIKPGKTKAAASAMMSHTGAMAGEDDVLEAALKQAGVIRCETLEDFFDFARALAWENAPLGPGVAVVSNAGGPAVISADAVIKEGLELVEFSDQTKNDLLKILPASASIINPVDVLGDALAERVATAAEIVLKESSVHSLLVILTPQIMTQISKTAQLIGGLSKKYKKPIFCSFIGGQLVAKGEKILNDYKIPSFRFPERAIAAMAALMKFKQRQEDIINSKKAVAASAPTEIKLEEEKIKTIITAAVKYNRPTLDNFEANELLAAAHMTTPPTQIVVSLKEAAAFAQKVGWPVVLKLSSPGLLHKKEGGIQAVYRIQLDFRFLFMRRTC